jgi:hypothetical protein
MIPSSPDYMQETALTIPFMVVKLLAHRLDSPGRQSKNAECMKHRLLSCVLVLEVGREWKTKTYSNVGEHGTIGD